MIRKTVIKLESIERIVLAMSPTQVIEYCPLCNDSVAMLTPQAASRAIGLTEREIFRLVESGTVGFKEGTGILVCLACLYR